jgi:hypothetical protein
MLTLSQQVNGLDIGKQLKDAGFIDSFMWWCKNPENPTRYIISPNRELKRVAPAFNASQLTEYVPESLEADGTSYTLHIMLRTGVWMGGYYHPNTGEPLMEEGADTITNMFARLALAVKAR